MATYAETQIDGGAWSQAPDHYSLFLAPHGMGYVEVAPDTDNADKFEVLDIPANVTPVRVARHLGAISIWRHPDQIIWSAVGDLPEGTLLRVSRDAATDGAAQIPARIADAAHWTGGRCIGWFLTR